MESVTGKIGDNDISIQQGDIAQTGADAILVPEFKSGVSTGGVGGAVARSGALRGMEQYGAYVKNNGHQDFGTVLLTPSGGGKSLYLLHVVSVNSSKEYEFEVIKTCVGNALKVAEENNITSIAVPALGTGIIGSLTARQSAEAMMGAIAEYGQHGGKPVRISFVIFNDPGAQQDFTAVLESASYLSANEAQVGGREFDEARYINNRLYDSMANRQAFGKNEPKPN